MNSFSASFLALRVLIRRILGISDISVDAREILESSGVSVMGGADCFEAKQLSKIYDVFVVGQTLERLNRLAPKYRFNLCGCKLLLGVRRNELGAVEGLCCSSSAIMRSD